MHIIEIQPLHNGAHRNQNGSFTTVPEGYAVIPDSINIPDTFPFVNITVSNGVVITMTAGTVPEPEPVPDQDVDPQEDTDALLVDHEYRLTMLELGV